MTAGFVSHLGWLQSVGGCPPTQIVTSSPATRGHSAAVRDRIDWGKQVTLDKDRASEYGVVAAYSGWAGRNGRLIDLSNNRFHATTSNGATVTALKNRQPALKLDGVSQYATAPDAYALNLLGDCYCSVWYYPRGLSTGYYTFAAKYDGATQPFNFFYRHNTGKLGMYYSGSSPDTAAECPTAQFLTDEQLYHIVIGWRASDQTLYGYVNGQSVGSVAYSGNRSASTGALTIGQTASSNYVPGSIYGLTLGSKPLTAAQVKNLYENPNYLYRRVNRVKTPITTISRPDIKLVKTVSRQRVRSAAAWSKPVVLDKQQATAYGVVAAYPGQSFGQRLLDATGKWPCEIVGSPRRSKGKFGEPAFDYSGSGDYAGSAAAISFPVGITMASWCLLKSYQTNSSTPDWGVRTIYDSKDSPNVDLHSIQIAGNPGVAAATFNWAGTIGAGSRSYISDSATFGLNVWRHVCGTYDGTTARLYVDGVQVASEAKSYALQPIVWQSIGRFTDLTLGGYFHGQISGTVICNRALTASQVYSLYKDPDLLYRPAGKWIPTVRVPANYFETGSGSVSLSANVSTGTSTAAEVKLTLPTKTRVRTAAAKDKIYWDKPLKLDDDKAQYMGIIAAMPFNARRPVWDYSRSKANCWMTGPVSASSPGRLGGRSISFDGNLDYANLDNSNGKLTVPTFTYSCWAYYRSIVTWSGVGPFGHIMGHGDTDSDVGSSMLWLYGTDPNVVAYVRLGNAAGVMGTTNLVRDNWYHLAATYDGATLKVYVNGKLDGSLATTTACGGTVRSFILGTANVSYGSAYRYSFNGKIANLLICNKALTDGQIAELYVNPLHFYTQPGRTKLVATEREIPNLYGTTNAASTGTLTLTNTATEYSSQTRVMVTRSDKTRVRSAASKDKIDWSKPVYVDRDLATEYGVVAAYAGKHRNSQRLIDLRGTSHGTLVNGTTWARDKFGAPCLSFDGSDDYATLGTAIPDAMRNLPTGDHWVSFWMKPNTSGELGLGTIYDCYADSGQGALAGGHGILIRDGLGAYGSVLSLQYSANFSVSDAYSVTQDNSVILGEWHHYYAVFLQSLGYALFYRDGQLLTNATTLAASGSYPTSDYLRELRIGNRRADTTRTFDGQISHLTFGRGSKTAYISELYRNPLRLYWQPGRSKLFFGAPPRIETVSIFRPNHTRVRSAAQRDKIDRSKPIRFDPDKAQDLSLLAAFPGNPRVGNKLYGVGPVKTNASLYPSATWLSGTVTPALWFNGSNQYGIMDDAGFANFERTQPFSVSLRFLLGDANTEMSLTGNLLSAGANYTGWEIIKDNSGNGNRMQLLLINTWPTNVIQQRCPFTPAAMTWYHFVATYDGSSQAAGVKFYLNGELLSSMAPENNTLTGSIKNNQALYIATRTGYGSIFSGYMSNWAYFGRALLPAQVQALYRDPNFLFWQPGRTKIFSRVVIPEGSAFNETSSGSVNLTATTTTDVPLTAKILVRSTKHRPRSAARPDKFDWRRPVYVNPEVRRELGLIALWAGKRGRLMTELVSGNHGNIINDPTITPGLCGEPGLNFGNSDAVDRYVDTNFTNQLDNFTCAVWYKSTGIYPLTYERVVDKSYANGFCINRQGSLPDTWDGYVRGGSVTTTNLKDGNINHIALSRKGRELSIWGNGQLGQYNALGAGDTLALSSDNLTIGLDDSTLAMVQNLYGIVYSVAIFNWELTSTWIHELYQRPSMLYWQPRNTKTVYISGGYSGLNANVSDTGSGQVTLTNDTSALIPASLVGLSLKSNNTRARSVAKKDRVDPDKPIKLNNQLAKTYKVGAAYLGSIGSSGDIVWDSGPFRQHAARYTNNGWSTGKFGEPALVLTGGNVWREDMRLTQDYSISAWAKYTDTAAITNFKIFMNFGGGGANSMWFGAFTDGLITLSYSNTLNDIKSTILATDNKWHHYVGVKSGTTFTAYLDGQLLGSSSSLVADRPNNYFHLGIYSTAPYYPWSGLVSNVVLFNDTLNAARVKELYQNPLMLYQQVNRTKIFDIRPARYGVSGTTSTGNASETGSGTLTLTSTVESAGSAALQMGVRATKVRTRSVTRLVPTKTKIDWSKKVYPDNDRCKELGITLAHIGTPIAGNKLVDIMGNYHGTLVGNNSKSRGQFGEPVIGVDGSGSYVDCGYIPELDGAANASFFGWIYRASNVSVGFGRAANSGDRFSCIWYTDGNLYTSYNSGYGYIGWGGTGWIHVAVTLDSSQGSNESRLRLYVNGVNYTQTYIGPVYSLTGSGYGWIIGKDDAARICGGSYSLLGLSATKTLTAEQVNKLYLDPFYLYWQPRKSKYFFNSPTPAGLYGTGNETASGTVTLTSSVETPAGLYGTGNETASGTVTLTSSVETPATDNLRIMRSNRTRVRSAARRDKIDWSKPVYIDRDRAQELGVVAVYPGNPGRGQLLADLGGGNNHGVFVGGPTWGSGQFREPALRLDAVDDYLNCGNNPALYPSGPLTIVARVYPTTVGFIWSSWGSVGGQARYASNWDGANFQASYRNSTDTDSPYRITATAQPAGSWYHYAAVINAPAGAIDLYVDGKLNNGAFTGTGTGWHSSTPTVTIGRLRVGDSYGQFGGLLSGITFCNKALTAQQIAELYQNPNLLYWQTRRTKYFFTQQTPGLFYTANVTATGNATLTAAVATDQQVANKLIVRSTRTRVRSAARQDRIDWAKPVYLDTDRAQDYGLVMAYPGSPGHGQVLYSRGRSNKHGLLVNSPGWTRGKFGEPALTHNNTDTHAAYDGPLPAPYPLTLLSWVNVSSTGTFQTPIILAVSGGAVYNSQCLIVQSGGLILAYTTASTGGPDVYASKAGYAYGTWAMAAAVYSAADNRVAYLNGEPGTAEASSRPTTTGDRLRLGCSYYNNLNRYDCTAKTWSMANSAIFNKALTTQQLVELYQNPFLLYWQPSRAKHFFGTSSGLYGTGNVTATGTVIAAGNVEDPVTIPKTVVQSTHTRVRSAARRDKIDWSKPVYLDKDVADAYGVISAYPGNPAHGDWLYDAGSFKRHGQLINAPAHVNGPNLTPALQFGSPKYVQFGSNFGRDHTTPTTVIVRALSTDPSTSYFLAGNAIEVSPWTGLWLLWGSGAGANQSRISWVTANGIGRDIISTSVKAINRWYDIAFTWDGNFTVGGMQIYENGVLQSTTVQFDLGSGGTAQTANWRMGVDGNSIDWFNGSINGLQIFNKVLSAKQIQTLYENPNLLYWQPRRLKIFAPLTQSGVTTSAMSETGSGYVTVTSAVETPATTADKTIVQSFKTRVRSAARRDKLDWSKPVYLDTDRAQDYGVIAAYPGRGYNSQRLLDTKGRNHGTLINGPTWTRGKFGEPAVSFDGTNDRIDIDGIVSATTGSSGFYSAWFKIASAGATNKLITVTNGGVTDATAGAAHFATRTNVTPGSVIRLDYTFVSNETNNIFGVYGSTTLLPDVWYHGLCQSNGSVVSLWLNGVQETLTTWADSLALGNNGRWWDDMTGTPTYARIGNCWYKNVEDSFFAGSIAGSVIGNKALTAAQISDLYNNPFLLYWQPRRAKYFFGTPAGVSVISAGNETGSGSITVTSAVETPATTASKIIVRPAKPRVRSAAQLDKIDWARPIYLDRDLAQDYGVVGIYPGKGYGSRTLIDLKGRYNGTLTGGPVWSRGTRGEPALQFDGVDDIVDFPGLPITGPPFTVCGWIHGPITSTAAPVIWSALSSSIDWNGYYISSTSGAYDVGLTVVVNGYAASSFCYASPVGLPYSRFFAGVVTSTTYRQCYMNGIPGAVDTTSLNPASFGALGYNIIGAARHASVPSIVTDNYTNGKLSNFLFSTKALTGSQIRRLYQNPFLLYWQPRRAKYFFGSPAGLYETISLSGSGALVLVGDSTPALTTSNTGSGFLTIVDTATVAATYIAGSSGAVVLADSATVSLAVTATGSGYVTLTNAASPQVSFVLTASGSVVLAGTGDVAISTSATATGALVLAGAGDPAMTTSATATGYLAIATTASSVSSIYAPDSTGFVTIVGAATADSVGVYYETGAGAVVLTSAVETPAVPATMFTRLNKTRVRSAARVDKLDWTKQVYLDKDLAQDYGVVAAYPGKGYNSRTLLDAAGNKHARLISVPNWSIGAAGEPALNFVSASSQYALASGAVVTDYPFSMWCWINFTDGTATYKDPFFLSDSASGNYYAGFQITPTTSYARYMCSNVPNFTFAPPQGTTALNDGKWHMLASSSLTDSHKLYVDGVLIVTDTTTVDFPPTNQLTLGTLDLGGTPVQYFNGRVSNCGVSRRALTAAQIAELYRNPLRLYWQPRRAKYFFGAPAGVSEIFNTSATGAVVLAGASTDSMTYVYANSGSGFLTLTNTATLQSVYGPTATGSVVIAGSVTPALTTVATATGYLTLDSTSAVAVTRSETATGYLTLTSTASGVAIICAPDSTGFITLNGIATVDNSGVYSETGSGSLTLTNTATLVLTYGVAGTGNILLTSTGSVAALYSLTATGSMILTGSNLPFGTQSEVGSGVLVLANSADVRYDANPTGSGSIVLASSATQALVYGPTASGAIGLTNTATVVSAYAVTATGTVTVTGDASVAASYVTVATGTVIVTGDATSSDASSRTGTGNVLLTGTATRLYTAVLQASGDLTLAGASTNNVGWIGVSTGSVVLTGLATDNTVAVVLATGSLELAATVSVFIVASQYGVHTEPAFLEIIGGLF